MTLPLPLEDLPESTRRFLNPAAPGAARVMAAKGLVPVKGGELLIVLAQLSVDADETVASTAQATLRSLPDAVVLPSLGAALHPAILERLAEVFEGAEAKLEILVQNNAISDAALERIARTASEPLTELIAVNQQRLLAAPRVIEALYKNKRTRMSTADRLVELAARNNVELTNLPAFKEHVEALEGTLIPEPDNEPLPSDLEFAQALIEDGDDPTAIEVDPEEGKETVKESFKPLRMRIGNMTKAEKIRLCVVGDAAARSILVRDNNRAVAHAAVTSPSMTEVEAVNIALSKEVSNEVLRVIANKKDWLRSYELKRALCFNPKTPVGLALKFMGHMRDNDIRELSRSRNVSMAMKTAAIQRLAKKQGVKVSFFKKLFGGKTFEDELRDADALFAAGELGHAKLAYDRAASATRDSVALAKVEAQIDACLDGIAERRLQAGREYLDGGEASLARDEFEGALETARSEAVRSKAERALEGLERNDAVQNATEDTPEMSDEERFAVLAGAFEDAQAEEYEAYGEPLIDGLLAMQDGDPKGALAALEGLLEEGEGARYLHLEVARARLLSGNAEGAEAAFRTFLASLEPTEGGESRFSAHAELARIADERGDFEGAIAELENAMEASDEDPRPFLALGQFLRAHGHPAEARDVLLPALPLLDETRPDWRFFHELGLAHKEAGDEAEARSHLERVLAIMTARQHHDFPPATVVALAQILEKQGELERAASLYRALTLGSDRPNHWLFHREAGRLLKAAGLDGEAERMFQRAMALVEHDEAARSSVVKARGGAPAEAEERP